MPEWVDHVIVGVAVIYSIILHELGHALTAYWCGDRTAKDLGRITLNPIPNIHWLGSLVVPVLLLVSTGGRLVFGWANPVPVQPANFRNRILGDVIVSMAGIVVNLSIAMIILFVHACVNESITERQGIVMWRVTQLNILLALFNLLPVPPLDGHHVFKYSLPRSWRPAYQSIGFFGILILLPVMFIPEAQLWMHDTIRDVATVMAKINRGILDFFR